MCGVQYDISIYTCIVYLECECFTTIPDDKKSITVNKDLDTDNPKLKKL